MNICQSQKQKKKENGLAPQRIVTLFSSEFPPLKKKYFGPTTTRMKKIKPVFVSNVVFRTFVFLKSLLVELLNY